MDHRIDATENECRLVDGRTGSRENYLPSTAACRALIRIVEIPDSLSCSVERLGTCLVFSTKSHPNPRSCPSNPVPAIQDAGRWCAIEAV
jgi:hypothetical protein